MLKKGMILRSPADFDNAMYIGVPFSVWQMNEIVDYGRPIERHTDEAVFINGGYFLKMNCIFKVR